MMNRMMLTGWWVFIFLLGFPDDVDWWGGWVFIFLLGFPDRCRINPPLRGYYFFDDVGGLFYAAGILDG
jgi:hypothetical protein